MSKQAQAAQGVSDSESDAEFDAEMQSKEAASCRFYREMFPQATDIVKVETVEITAIGAKVRLLEYGGLEGFIQMGHVTNKRVRSVLKLLKIGKREMMEVLRVDEAKQYIDLSKKNILREALEESEERWKKSKKVHEIMIETSIKIKAPIEELYEAWGWDLYDKCGFEHALDALRVALQ